MVKLVYSFQEPVDQLELPHYFRARIAELIEDHQIL